MPCQELCKRLYYLLGPLLNTNSVVQPVLGRFTIQTRRCQAGACSLRRRVRMPAYASELRALEAEALDAERCVQGITEEHAHAAAALLTRMERQAFAAPMRQSEQLQQLHAMARTASLDRSPHTRRPPLCCALLRSDLPVTPCQSKSRQELFCWSP